MSPKPRSNRCPRNPVASPANADIERWINAFLTEAPPRAKSLVATVFGDAIAPHGSTVWLGSLIKILASFNFNDRLVRTSVFRLTDEGLLESHRQGRLASYTLTASGRSRFEHAHRRIFTLPEQVWNGTWTLVLMPRTGNAEMDKTELRRELEWQGFAAIAPGVMAHPAGDTVALYEILQSLELLDKVHVVLARDIEDFGTRPTRDLVMQSWDMAALAANYQAFIERFQPLLTLLQQQEYINPLQAFQVRTLLMHAYRRAILDDPQFPADILPADWPGHIAYALCREIYVRCVCPSEQHLSQMLGTKDQPLPPPLPYFFQRFGGLPQ